MIIKIVENSTGEITQWLPDAQVSKSIEIMRDNLLRAAIEKALSMPHNAGKTVDDIDVDIYSIEF